ncbi:MAG: hypothetical protein ACE5E7_15670 [Anaerolineae bacterium]
MFPYFLMAILYLSLAVLEALDASFVSLRLLPWFNGMRWLRVHLITLGVLTQVLFSLMPMLVAIRHRLPRPHFRWSIWLTLNAGILTLLVGIPLVNIVPILGGGTLVFIATALLVAQLSGMKPTEGSADNAAHAGRKFYIAGLGYFLLGIIVGTGMWIGWAETLHIAAPVEVHIHANNWGLISLVFAGLLVDMYPVWAKRPFANPQSVNFIFWGMVIGALGLIFGPWFQLKWLLVPGLLLHLAATIWLLVNIIKPLWGERRTWAPGIWHLFLSYFWILAPVAAAPLVLFKIPGIPAGTIETTAPQALIYGWLLQFGFAVIPFFFVRLFQPDKPSQLGGTWLSLVLINLGGVFLWASIFIAPAQGILHGIAYLWWTAAMLPVVSQLWHIVRAGLARYESQSELEAIGL